jgi:hypothetical protein
MEAITMDNGSIQMLRNIIKSLNEIIEYDEGICNKEITILEDVIHTLEMMKAGHYED